VEKWIIQVISDKEDRANQPTKEEKDNLVCSQRDGDTEQMDKYLIKDFNSYYKYTLC